MKLQILIPQHRETDEVVKPLLDSLALQQSVDLAHEVGVVICNDGSDVRLSEELLGGYPFPIEYHLEPHRGVSGARNACLDHATADYVMFCDADDMFCSVCGLYIILREIDAGGFDSLVSLFIEETRAPGTGEPVYVNHEGDSTFVHGKVHRRQYLLEKAIRWNEALTVHEDSFFNILCQNLSRNVKYCQTPFYLWRWRDESVCRHDPKYILKTYRNMIDSNSALVDEFLRRGMQDKAAFYASFLIFDAYYSMNKPEWINQENRAYRDSTERHFAKYFKKRRPLWESMPPQEKMQLSNGVRSRSVGEGMLMEAVTIDDWLSRIGKKSKKKRGAKPDA